MRNLYFFEIIKTSMLELVLRRTSNLMQIMENCCKLPASLKHHQYLSAYVATNVRTIGVV